MYKYLQYFPPVVLGKSQLLLIQGIQGSSGYSRFLLFYAMFAINQVHLNIGGWNRKAFVKDGLIKGHKIEKTIVLKAFYIKYKKYNRQ